MPFLIVQGRSGECQLHSCPSTSRAKNRVTPFTRVRYKGKSITVGTVISRHRADYCSTWYLLSASAPQSESCDGSIPYRRHRNVLRICTRHRRRNRLPSTRASGEIPLHVVSDIMGRVGFLQNIQNQRWEVAPVEHVDLTGKTVVIVGANVGLGFEAAKHFASMNPKRLVLGCRSQEKGQAALQGKQATTIISTGPLLRLNNLLYFDHGQPYKPRVLRMKRRESLGVFLPHQLSV
jgi:hypothetical protein